MFDNPTKFEFLLDGYIPKLLEKFLFKSTKKQISDICPILLSAQVTVLILIFTVGNIQAKKFATTNTSKHLMNMEKFV